MSKDERPWSERKTGWWAGFWLRQALLPGWLRLLFDQWRFRDK